MKEWNGKTKGTPWGYKFFILTIKIFGIRIAYFFSNFVSLYFLFFSVKERNALILFYKTGFSDTTFKAFINAYKTFRIFGEILIDRTSFNTKSSSKISYTFENEEAFHKISKLQKGGLLMSAHIGNWEIAGNLIHDRVSEKINIVMLDNEVESIKRILNEKVGKPKFNLIAIKEDFSHLIKIKQAIDRNEFVAMHADRIINEKKSVAIDFLGAKALFPLGPFLIAEKLKVPVSFVYAIKTSKFHYHLSMTDPIDTNLTAMQLAELYVGELEKMTKKNKNQWFNFYPYHVS
jgi:predicted LPLAT superfamily acyltransferase